MARFRHRLPRSRQKNRAALQRLPGAGLSIFGRPVRLLSRTGSETKEMVTMLEAALAGSLIEPHGSRACPAGNSGMAGLVRLALAILVIISFAGFMDMSAGEGRAVEPADSPAIAQSIR
jgi:hypothetical protein